MKIINIDDKDHLPQKNNSLEGEIFFETQNRFCNFLKNHYLPNHKKLLRSCITEDGWGKSNAHFGTTLQILCIGLGIDHEIMESCAAKVTGGLYNTGVYLPEYDFTKLNNKVLYIFPEARFGYTKPRADFALYYKNGFYEKKIVIEVQTQNHNDLNIYEDDCHRSQYLWKLGWSTIWISSRQVYNDKEGKYFIGILDKLLSESKECFYEEKKYSPIDNPF